MAVNALYPYKYPSRSRQELYGDDIMVHVAFRGNMLFAAASSWRMPPSTRWADFICDTVDPWAAMDPRVDLGSIGDWYLDGEPLKPTAGATLAELGVGHKSMLSFSAG